jgi:hypothetical protein
MLVMIGKPQVDDGHTFEHGYLRPYWFRQQSGQMYSRTAKSLLILNGVLVLR